MLSLSQALSLIAFVKELDADKEQDDSTTKLVQEVATLFAFETEEKTSSQHPNECPFHFPWVYGGGNLCCKFPQEGVDLKNKTREGCSGEKRLTLKSECCKDDTYSDCESTNGLPCKNNPEIVKRWNTKKLLVAGCKNKKWDIVRKSIGMTGGPIEDIYLNGFEDNNSVLLHRRTLLICAVIDGQEDIVRYILGPKQTRSSPSEPRVYIGPLGEVNTNMVDYKGKTALWWAEEKGHENIVNALLCDEDSDHICSSSAQCFPNTQVCDGKFDCADFSDEFACGFCGRRCMYFRHRRHLWRLYFLTFAMLFLMLLVCCCFCRTKYPVAPQRKIAPNAMTPAFSRKTGRRLSQLSGGIQAGPKPKFVYGQEGPAVPYGHQLYGEHQFPPQNPAPPSVEGIRRTRVSGMNPLADAVKL